MSDSSRMRLADDCRSSTYYSSRVDGPATKSSSTANRKQSRRHPKYGNDKLPSKREQKLSRHDNKYELQDRNLDYDRQSTSCESSRSSQLRYGAKSVIDLFIPVSICIWLVIATIKATDRYHYSSQTVVWYAQLMFTDQTVDTKTRIWQSFANAMTMLMVIILMTTLLILLYRYNCYRIIYIWLMMISLVLLFAFMLIYISVFLKVYNVPLDLLTLNIVIWNFGVLGMLCIHWKGPLLLQQGYLIIISALMALLFLQCLPDWTVWTLLLIVSIWDLVAVLCPRGPLRILVETAEERNEQIFPALIYSSTMIWELAALTSMASLSMADERYKKPNGRIRARSYRDEHTPSTSISLPNTPIKNVNYRFHGDMRTPTPRKRSDNFPHEIQYEDGARTPEITIIQTTRRDQDDSEDIFGKIKLKPIQRSKPMPSADLDYTPSRKIPILREDGVLSVPRSTFNFCEGSQADKCHYELPETEERGVKLGLGDFIFFSVLMGKVSTYADWTITISCYVSVLVGLCLTLSLLTIFRKALPALPISIAFGMISFFFSYSFVVPLAADLSINQIFI